VTVSRFLDNTGGSGKAMGGPAGWSGRRDACREVLGRFKGVNVTLDPRAFEVEFESEMDLVEFGLIVVYPLASQIGYEKTI
jgi:hypothetical protein